MPPEIYTHYHVYRQDPECSDENFYPMTVDGGAKPIEFITNNGLNDALKSALKMRPATRKETILVRLTNGGGIGVFTVWPNTDYHIERARVF